MQLISVSKRTRNRYPAYRGPGYSPARAEREYQAKPRIYFSHDGEGILTHLANRTSRSIAMYRQQIPAVMRLLGLPEGTRVRWSRHAGCSMCPCSPGFIVEGDLDLPYDRRHWDAWVTVHGDLIDTRNPAAVARARDRAAQVLAGPSLAATVSIGP